MQDGAAVFLRTAAPTPYKHGQEREAAMDDETQGTAVCELAPAPDTVVEGITPAADDAGPRADCVQCGERTEYPADRPGGTLCALCTWQQAPRMACSG